ncbi:uncharacterized protein MAM_03356 [Metarhizium album ARSEF 1941]|uniref:Uncharacterized protein n=1 Tax=Metarhizium album (strain ARSEF 1941) TaxID=1081103 RepID=A0A0B2WZ94_METAS|nr:uncharacterized protein MAM_03356 [Metarhizium album ARSEF 1941]KHN98894.1 hypothetical protein MAM_03356 [Metarhizium album ARSEF 1941]
MVKSLVAHALGHVNLVYGAHNYDIEVEASINGGGHGFSATTSQSNRWDSQWPLDGWTCAVAVRASAGDSIKAQYTGSQSAVAKPQLAPAPANIQVQPTNSGAGTLPVSGGLTVDSKDPATVRITWTGSDSAGGYHV